MSESDRSSQSTSDESIERAMSAISTKAVTSIWFLIKRFVPYLYCVRGRVAVASALMLLNPLIAASLLWLMKVLIDEVFVSKKIHLLPRFLLAYVILVAVKLAADYTVTRIDAAINEQINQHVRGDLYRHLISVSAGSLKKFSIGDLLSRLLGDAERVAYLVYSGPVGVILNVLSAVFFICFLVLLSWELTLCALLSAPLLTLLSLRLSSRVRRTAMVSRHKVSAWVARAEERLGDTQVIHAFGAETAERDAFVVRTTAARKAELQSVAVQAWFTLLVEMAGAVGGLIILGVGGYEMYFGSLTIGSLIAFLGSVGSLYSPISSLARASARFQRAAVGAQRVVELLDAKSLVVQRPDATPLTHVQGVLEFSNVSFAYPGGPQILQGVSFRAAPGEVVAIVGPNGSGKSTIVQLALRLYDPLQGTVSIDGSDLREVTLESLRHAVSVVFQESGLFRGTVGENIRYGRPGASDGAFAEMTQAAHVHSFIGSLPRGYSTPIGARGSWLSGGQRQRVALARAFLRDTPVLLLDEAMGSVDSEVEQLIQEALDRFAGKRTMLVVSHRIRSILRANRIVVLNEGKIVEMGSPAELQRPGTRFHELFAAQA